MSHPTPEPEAPFHLNQLGQTRQFGPPRRRGISQLTWVWIAAGICAVILAGYLLISSGVLDTSADKAVKACQTRVSQDPRASSQTTFLSGRAVFVQGSEDRWNVAGSLTAVDSSARTVFAEYTCTVDSGRVITFSIS